MCEWMAARHGSCVEKNLFMYELLRVALLRTLAVPVKAWGTAKSKTPNMAATSVLVPKLTSACPSDWTACALVCMPNEK